VLLQRHHQAIAEGKASIIVGLDRFAEGLDLPGTACVQVSIAKLPFAMPANPIEKSQNRWIVQRGGNPVIQITVPEP
ncbi:helicase C-terminal domain-containing protein, partial [Neisseria sp. P0014.S002]|uniref:helicase C-terminal domain-containing protein n=1 Tax=Neisseria sp. P0014.S002 TaxID=3436748 RepID=UPI003F7DFD33